MKVTVTVVAYNSCAYISRCLDAVLRQSGVDLEIIVVDNASSDGTLEALDRFRGRIRLIRNTRNAGFAVAQNQAIAAGSGEWVLALNPDVLLEPDFARQLVEAGQID